MRIDFHSEKFKKAMVWIIAIVILPSFLIGGGALSGLFSSGAQNRLEEVKITVFGDEVDPVEYHNFSQRWAIMFKNFFAILNGDLLSEAQKASFDAGAAGAQIFPNAQEYSQATFYDCYRPAGMILKVYNWIPGENRQDIGKLISEKSDIFKNPVVASLFARAHRAEKQGLMPSNEEIDGKLYYWFNKPDYEINWRVFDKEGYRDFVTKLYAGMAFETADRYFRKTVGEYIAMDRLEKSENSLYDKKTDGLAGNDVLKRINDKEQRKVDYVYFDVNQFKPKAAADYKAAAAAPDLDKLKKLYETFVDPEDHDKGHVYQQPRSFSGSILLIDMAKVNDKIRPDAEKEAEKQKASDEEIEEYYNEHKLDYLIPEKPAEEPKPENGKPEGEDNDGNGSDGEESGSDAPAATPVSDDTTETAPAENGGESTEQPAPADDKETKPAEQPAPEEPKAPQYKPIEEVKDEIVTAIKKEKAMNAAREKHLDDLYDELTDYVNEQRQIDVDAIAAKVFKNGSLGGMFGQLAEFAAALAGAAEAVEKLPDLKAFAEKHDEITLTKTETYVNIETARDAEKIGGQPYANLLDRDFHELDKYYAFGATNPGTAKYMLSRITDGTRKDGKDPEYKFVLRIEDVREPELLPFDKVETEAPATHKKLLKDYDDKCITENAHKLMADAAKAVEEQIKANEYDFDAGAEKVAQAVKAYDEWKKNKDKKDEDKDGEDADGDDETPETDDTAAADTDEPDAEKKPEYETTGYFARTGYFPGAYTQEAVMQKVFKLGDDEIACISVKPEKDAEYESLLVMRLHKGDDEKPVRRMSFKEFRDMMAEDWSPVNNQTTENNKRRFEAYAAAVTIVIPELTEEELEERRQQAEDEE